jgi:hypothetical protein
MKINLDTKITSEVKFSLRHSNLKEMYLTRPKKSTEAIFILKAALIDPDDGLYNPVTPILIHLN